MDKSKVCPILFEISVSDIKGPLAQFNAAPFEEDEIKKLVKAINQEMPEETRLSERVFESSFARWWPDLKLAVDSALKHTRPGERIPERSEKDILNETLNLARQSSSGLQDALKYLKEKKCPRDMEPNLLGRYNNPTSWGLDDRPGFSNRPVSRLLATYGWSIFAHL